MTTSLDYWRECMELAAEECDLQLTQDQIAHLAAAADSGHEHYGMAFYSPPASDRIAAIDRDCSDKLKNLQAEFDEYRICAEKAIRRATNQNIDAQIGINKHGDVIRYGGRTERIL